jgi:succinate dehydrogenase / fumarate reductase flavoprotein subunit
MGGVVVDAVGETDVAGLYAVGETMAGVHGANRLGGNSLAETLAFGAVAGEAIAERLGSAPAGDARLLHERAGVHFDDLARLAGADGAYDPEALLDELRDLLWEHAGIRRDEASLAAGLDALSTLRARASDLAVGERTARSFEFAMNLGFALDVAEGILRGAAVRTESRGAHARTDHPESDPEWRRTVVIDRDAVGGMRLDTAPVDEPSEAVRAALDAGYELDYHQLE